MSESRVCYWTTSLNLVLIRCLTKALQQDGCWPTWQSEHSCCGRRTGSTTSDSALLCLNFFRCIKDLFMASEFDFRFQFKLIYLWGNYFKPLFRTALQYQTSETAVCAMQWMSLTTRWSQFQSFVIPALSIRMTVLHKNNMKANVYFCTGSIL